MSRESKKGLGGKAAARENPLAGFDRAGNAARRPFLLSPNTGHWEVSGVTGKASLKAEPNESERASQRVAW
jgi:hypothetical protein